MVRKLNKGRLSFLTIKAFLTHPETARDFLQPHLPSNLLKACYLDTFKL